jgi:hypothetical protein
MSHSWPHEVYLPLQESVVTKGPEVCVLDVKTGKIVSHVKSKDKDVPGNLFFFDGQVISLTPREVVAYPWLRVKVAEINSLLDKNPNDPLGLTERAALRVQKGDLSGAIEDLRNALKSNPPQPLREWVRERLFETLTEFLATNPATAEDYLKDYEELCVVDLTGLEGAKRKAAQAESRRRRGRYLSLVAGMRESQGKLLDALKAYLELAALGPSEEMLPVPGETTLKVGRDVWSRIRIDSMMKKATPQQRKQLDEELERRLKNDQGDK